MGKETIRGMEINMSRRGQSTRNKGEEGSNVNAPTQEFTKNNDPFRRKETYKGNTNP